MDLTGKKESISLIGVDRVIALWNINRLMVRTLALDWQEVWVRILL